MHLLALVLGCLACTEPKAPEAVPRDQPVLAIAPLQLDSACSRISFTFVGSTGIKVTYPDRDACTKGMVVIPGGTPTRSGRGSRDATIPLRLLNQTGNRVRTPVPVLLMRENRAVVMPAGVDRANVKPQNHDSLRSDGSWLRLIGGNGTVGNQDSTATQTFVIRLDSPAASAQATFSIEAQELSPGGWLLLSTLPLLDATKKVTRPGTNVVYLRTHATLAFQQRVSEEAKQTFFIQNKLLVLGVTPGGVFFVSFPDPGTSMEALDAFIATLRARPEVRSVMAYIYQGISEKIESRSPNDTSSSILILEL